MTYEKVLDVFKEYLAEEDLWDVLHTSQGYLVVDWVSVEARSQWVKSKLCQTPEQLRDFLRYCYEEHLANKLSDNPNYKFSPSEKAEISRMGEEMVRRCDKK